jgi:hypothetical protein
MRRLVTIAGLTLGLTSVGAVSTAQPKSPVKATHAVELTDPAGDVGQIMTSDGNFPGLDVVKMAIRSDGKQITFVAMLKEPPGNAASDALRIYIDTDRDPKTGAGLKSPKVGGFEYRADLLACFEFSRPDGARGSSCAGGLDAKAKEKITGRFAMASLHKYTGPGEYDADSLVNLSAFPAMGGKPAARAAPRVPLSGSVVQAALDYTDLGVKPGQTIRLVVKESSSDKPPDGGLFPEILLTLK